MPKKTTDSDVTFIAALAELLNDNDLTELEVKRQYGNHDSLNVRVSRKNDVFTQMAAAPLVAPAQIAQGPASISEPAASPAEDPAADPNAITSPMVGTVYLASEPGAGAFISIGDQVAEGDTLLIIEAMKTMNHIPAPRAGKIKRILVDDGVMAEFGTPLVIIE